MTTVYEPRQCTPEQVVHHTVKCMAMEPEPETKVILEQFPPEIASAYNIPWSPNIIVQALCCTECGIKTKLIGYGTVSGPFQIISSEKSHGEDGWPLDLPPSTPESPAS